MPLNESEVHWQIVHGKPYEGKLHVRFGEGSPETGWQVTTALVTYSTILLPRTRRSFRIRTSGGGRPHANIARGYRSGDGAAVQLELKGLSGQPEETPTSPKGDAAFL